MCGIFAAFSKNENVARQIFFALMALQHRGQEAAGMAISNGKSISYKKETGMVSQIFHERHLSNLQGRLGIGHTRYSTTENKNDGRQPFQFACKLGPFSIAHNGEITDYEKIKADLMSQGVCFFTDSDTELLAHYISRSEKSTWRDILAELIKTVPGAYSIVILTPTDIWALRDPIGTRLLSIGQRGDDWYIASESCCFNVIDATDRGSVPPGTLIQLNETGMHQETIHQRPQSTCAFEFVYFARPDSVIDGVYVNQVRQEIGKQLWEMTKDYFVGDYLVSGVPESATPMAIGFSHASGIPYNEIFAKNRYIHRTFIKPVNSERKSAVYLKFNPLVNNIAGKKIILIDDSIVRGNTIEHLAKILKSAGAKEIHILVGSPEIRHPCYMGIDMKNENEFIMNDTTPKQLAEKIGVDSVHFLDIQHLYTALGRDDLCVGCWTGKYPKELEW